MDYSCIIQREGALLLSNLSCFDKHNDSLLDLITDIVQVVDGLLNWSSHGLKQAQIKTPIATHALILNIPHCMLISRVAQLVSVVGS